MGRTSTEVKNRYNAKAYDRIELKVYKGDKDKYKEAASSKGMSLNEFIRYCVDKEIEKQ